MYGPGSSKKKKMELARWAKEEVSFLLVHTTGKEKKGGGVVTHLYHH